MGRMDQPSASGHIGFQCDRLGSLKRWRGENVGWTASVAPGRLMLVSGFH